MQNNEPIQPGNPMYSSVAYKYLYGQKQPYGYSSSAALYPAKQEFYAKSFFSTGTPITRIDEGPQTVEQLVSQGYFAVPAFDPETAFLSDKKHTSWLGLDDVIGQIDQRQKIYGQNMNEIEWSKCYAFNELARGGWPPTSEQQDTYSKRLLELHSDQRHERTSLWKDISRLRQQLPESAQQYLSAFRKIEILNDIAGDYP
ncbi:MAG: hypothetical protein H8D56_12870 [Planctomycetes bacterium]|nr:hypothetical protein [Planctomycetota bacterium]